jgi:(2Fe-2S) ferredoxin
VLGDAPPGESVPAAEARYLIVCRGPHCRHLGSMLLRARLATLLRGREDLRLAGYACFAQCEHGPNALVYPEGTWFGHLDQPGDAERLIRHATGEQPMADAPLDVPPAEREEHLANVAELLRTLERDRARQARTRRWWWPF